MIKTPLSTVIGGAFWTPGATVIGGNTPTFDQQIQKLFANGEQGFFYDPNDLSTMYQDAAGTVPVTAAGQPVGMIRDKSGRNNHAYQTTSAARPILQRNATTGAYYLAFDGADDFLRTNNINFTTTDKVSLFAGVRKLSDALAGIIIESSLSIVATGTFALTAPSSASVPSFSARVNATPSGISTAIASGNAAPISAVLTAKIDISAEDGKEVLIRVNRATQNYNGANLVGTGNFRNDSFFIGKRNDPSFSYPFNGHLYGLIGIGRLTTDSETAALEKAIAKNTGVTLNV